MTQESLEKTMKHRTIIVKIFNRSSPEQLALIESVSICITSHHKVVKSCLQRASL